MAHRLTARFQRPWQGVRRPDDVGEFLHVELADDFTDDKISFHAGLTMPGDGAPVVEGAFDVGAEHDRGAAALAIDDRAVGVGELVDEDVVCDVVAVDKGYLHYLTGLCDQVRVGDTIDGPTDPDERHATTGQAGGEGVADVGQVLGRRGGLFTTL